MRGRPLLGGLRRELPVMDGPPHPSAVPVCPRPGELFTTFHTVDVFINAVIGPHQDGVTHTPAYKVTAVRVERARDDFS
ncbi:hypothetical protein [Pyxidicoccus sp. MSG2]|uniref:hypothetical protein n=1 Tax=Pyxidicoccus sp. MSG2 TaxID=2996790 RepID=UPI002271D845|nr:hypothetical protein [Pyxidicoccus sp. MSG2]MCY1022361.1 hypothetical protein [Pyxidicoccus sp. MSG2]